MSILHAHVFMLLIFHLLHHVLNENMIPGIKNCQRLDFNAHLRTCAPGLDRYDRYARRVHGNRTRVRRISLTGHRTGFNTTATPPRYQLLLRTQFNGRNT